MKQSDRVIIACGCCKGTGTVYLSGVYSETLVLLKRQRRAISGADLARLAGCTGEAMCNRLASLERKGLATSQKYGRERHWKAGTP